VSTGTTRRTAAIRERRPGDDRRDRRGRGDRNARRGRQLADLHVFRYVPGTSFVHRCWAGTKILVIALLSTGVILWPTWRAAGIAAALVLTAYLAAHLPRGVAPRIPRWIWIFFAIGFLLALAAGGKPELHIAGTRVGVGGVEVWARFLVLGIEVLAMAGLVSWTTPLADLAPALGRLGAPFRKLRLPVDEIVGAIALGIRCLPLLLEEFRVLNAARRTRRPEPLTTLKERADALEETLFTALASSLRRSREMAEAIEARGGVPRPLAETHPFTRLDATILVVCVAAVFGMAVLR
jgi:energy-coupling factor transporter transmembrane protein EcfT